MAWRRIRRALTACVRTAAATLAVTFTMSVTCIAATPHGFTFTTLNAPGASQGTYAAGINDAGQIVGSFEDSAGISHGFLSSGGKFTTLNAPGASHGTYAAGINDAGQIVGYFQDSTYGYHGFL
jgi:probable HAF family extracellular repeat protein